MTRSNSIRALTLSAILALGAPLTAFAAPDNTGGAAEASEFQVARPMQTTRGSVLVAEQKGGGSQATGNPLATQVPIARYMVGDSVLANSGNGSVTSHDFGNGAQG